MRLYIAFVIFSLSVLVLQAEEPVTEAKLMEDSSVASLRVRGEELHFKAKEGHFWNWLVTSGDGQKAYALLEEGNPHKSWTHRDVYEFSPADYLQNPQRYKPRGIGLVGDLSKPGSVSFGKEGITIRRASDASVVEIYSASKDGGILLISLRYHPEKSSASEMPIEYPDFSFRETPWFLDTRTGKVTEVKARE